MPVLELIAGRVYSRIDSSGIVCDALWGAVCGPSQRKERGQGLGLFLFAIETWVWSPGPVVCVGCELLVIGRKKKVPKALASRLV